MDDFFLYQPREERNIPTAVYGAAALELIKRKQYPPWALFVFKDLKEAASGEPPALLGFIGEKALLIAPILKGNSVRCMLICNEQAYGQELLLTSPCGQSIKVYIPVLTGRYTAVENIELEIR